MNNEEKILEILVQMQAVQVQMQSDISGLKTTQEQMQTDIAGLKAKVELDIDRKLQMLAEGHDSLSEQLNTLADVKELAEVTKDKVDVIYSVVSQHSKDISVLKKAK